MSRRVLVCGGRNYQDANRVNRVLDAAHTHRPFDVVIHGAYRGADTLAKEWAKSRGVPDLPFPAEWHMQGRVAGPQRNQRMIDEGKPDIVVAFPGGDGTADMVERAYAAGIKAVDLRK